MVHKKRNKKLSNMTHASVKKETAKPRMAKSARIAELNLDTERIPQQPSTTMHHSRLAATSRPRTMKRFGACPT